jgi:starch-binding outer membrane protein, SusD/RagB family
MKIIKLGLFALSLLAIASCDNTLDLAPEDSLTPEIIFSNESLASNAVNGMYSSLQSSNVLNGIPDSMGEWQSDNVNFVGSFPTFAEIRDYSTLSDNISVLNVWNSHYLSVNQANMIIKYVPGIADPNFTQASKDNMVGQARFVRALMYFKLSTFFGRQLKQDATGNSLSIPLVLEPYQGVVNKPARATLNAVYAQIEADLKFAETAITNTSKVMATSAAAKALLARLYLYQERWADAANYANQVINTSGFSLASNFSFYNNPSTEHVFQLVNVSADAGFAESFAKLYSPSAFGGRGDCPFSQDLINDFLTEPADLRYNLKRSGTDAAGNSSLFSTKYPNGTSNLDDANVIRIAEMYLIRCEANFKAGTTVGDTPLNDLNAIRTRAGLANLGAVTNDAILTERRKEFCFEGLRRMDLLRNNMPLRKASMSNSADSQPTANKVLLPIPQRERDNNPNLIQNPGF